MRCSFCAGEKGKKPGKEKGKGKGKGKGKKSDSSLPTIIPVSPNWGFGHWDTFLNLQMVSRRFFRNGCISFVCVCGISIMFAVPISSCKAAMS